MLGLVLIGVLIPAIIVSGESDRPYHEPLVVIPVLEQSTDSLRACTSLTGSAPCSTQSRELKVESSSTQPPTDAPTTQNTPVLQVAPEPEPAAEALPTMEVREGDTLVAIADWFGVSPFEIAVVNAMSVDDYLQIGATLAIPVPAAVFSIPPDPMAVAAALEVPDEYVAPPAAPIVTDPPHPTAPPYIPPTGDQVVAAICSLPWPCEQMVRIASCESGLNPRAVNPIGYYGLFQIDHQFAGWDDAYTNASVAYFEKYLPALAHGNGLSPWPVCQHY